MLHAATSMQRVPTALLTLALAIALGLAQSRTPAPHHERPAKEQEDARTLLRSAVDAFGGEPWLKLKSQVSRGTGSLKPPSSPQPFPLKSVVIMRVFPDLRRTDLELPFGAITQVFNGQQGWVTAIGQQQDQTEAMKQASRFGLDLLRRMEEEDLSARLLGEAEVEGKKARGAGLSDAEDHATRFWIDSETGRVLKVEYSLAGQQIEEFYADYREVEDLRLPHKYWRLVNGDKALEIDFAAFRINQEIDPSLFVKDTEP